MSVFQKNASVDVKAVCDVYGARLDEALKATEDLEPTQADVAVVRAASAYERVDADGVMRRGRPTTLASNWWACRCAARRGGPARR